MVILCCYCNLHGYREHFKVTITFFLILKKGQIKKMYVYNHLNSVIGQL